MDYLILYNYLQNAQILHIYNILDRSLAIKV